MDAALSQHRLWKMHMKISFSGTLSEFKDFVKTEVVDPIVTQITTRFNQMSEILQAKVNELEAKITLLINSEVDLKAGLASLQNSNADLTASNAALVASVDNTKVVMDHVATTTTATLTLLAQLKSDLDSAGTDTALVARLQTAIDQVDSVNASVQAATGTVGAAVTAETAAIAGETAAKTESDATATEGAAVTQSESDAIATNAE
jgi:hypothetical protein